ncbi:hypothetical protein INJ05_000621 [Salmonella enterica]|jgi:hypothetical protein|uniref:hypothetical protein n=1 Tax=Enterobacterales TaxID=91347 RepID=UPI00107CE55E|nr:MULTISPECIES: hypothetical protein [Enterobacterales]EAB9078813.1 hypothetical protein [Salmonella enterica subsp. enterica]EAQ5328267.1 hypothetical protein [Salmonella enterica]EIL3027385.1 hypothetical protein [Salmonella enterica subsp. enterica serovar Schwarzengrund]EDR7627605.1 hypothetical protein [Salmonella enterica subsp. enterica]EGL2811665.1 hypothetical protein [Salmonella enterica]
MKFNMCVNENGVYHEAFDFWDNAILKALFEYDRLIELGIIEAKVNEEEFCEIITFLSISPHVVSSLPNSSFYLNSMSSDDVPPITLERIRLVVSQPISNFIHHGLVLGNDGSCQ